MVVDNGGSWVPRRVITVSRHRDEKIRTRHRDQPLQPIMRNSRLNGISQAGKKFSLPLIPFYSQFRMYEQTDNTNRN